MKEYSSLIPILLLAAISLSCGRSESPSSDSGSAKVVIYCALDQIFSEPLIKKFEQQTGITVQAVYDVEASKTIGLVNRLIAEKNAPVCDVFWNNEILQTLVLQQQGLLQPYESPSAVNIPAVWQDAGHEWAGFAARARVIIVNANTYPDPANQPEHLADFLAPANSGKAAIASPLFGTTATHAAVWFSNWGPDKAKQFFNAIKSNKVAVLAGNATVRDLVVQGEYSFGLTDTDDAVVAIETGKPVRMVFPDQDGEGTLLIPNSVAMIKGAPNPEAAKKLIDFILSAEVEQALADGRSAQIPLRPGLRSPKHIPPIEELKFMEFNYAEILKWRDPSVEYVRDDFLVK